MVDWQDGRDLKLDLICVHDVLYNRGRQRNSPMPTRSAGIPATIPERDYSSGQPTTGGASEPDGDQEREPNPAATPG
jgi:hypothetical protein